MKAAVLEAPEQVRVQTVPDPAVEAEGDVIVRVRAGALCGADLFPYHGHVPGFEFGIVPGHEFVGEVVEVGPGVRTLREGQRVVCSSMISCGTCAHCRLGRPTQCPNRALFGFSGVYPRLDGGLAEHVRVPYADRALWPVPDGVGDDAAVFVGDMLPTAYEAVRRAGLQGGESVVVLGCGPLGLMAVLLARGTAGRLIAVDGIPARRELAAALGAHAVTPEEAAATVAEATGGLGCDVVIECAGSAAALRAAIELPRGRGRVIVIAAHFEPDFPLDCGRMFERELELSFAIGDPTNHRMRLLDMIEAGVLDPTPAITHRFALADAAEAYAVFDRREAIKVFLQP